MPKESLKFSTIQTQLDEWNKHAAVNIIKPKFIQDLDLLYALNGPGSSSINQAVYMPIESETEQSPVATLTDQQELQLLFILESRTLRNSMAARNVTATSLFTIDESVSGKIHRELLDEFENTNSLTNKQIIAARQIIKYLHVQGVKEWEDVRKWFVDPNRLPEYATQIKILYDKGELNKDSQPNALATMPPITHGLQIRDGIPLWQFREVSTRAPATTQPDANTRFRQFADLGCLHDHGLLSNQLINIFGGRVLTHKRQKAANKDNAHSNPAEGLEIEACERMVTKIRLLQDVELCINVNTKFQDNLARVKNNIQTELTSYLQREFVEIDAKIISEQNKNPRSSPALLNALEQEKQSLLQLGSEVRKLNGVTNRSELLQWQRNTYRQMMSDFQRTQGYISASQAIFTENESNTHTTQEGYYAIQDFTMAAGVEVTEDMLNRTPNELEFMVKLDPRVVNKPQDAAFAAAYIDTIQILQQQEKENQTTPVIYQQTQTHHQQFLKLAHFEKVQHASVRNLDARLRPTSALRRDMFRLTNQQHAISSEAIADLKAPALSKDTDDSIQDDELLNYQTLLSRQSAEAVQSDDFIGSGLRVVNHFALMFDKMAASRPYTMAAAFSIPYMQLGFTGLSLASHSHLAEMLLHVAHDITVMEAKGITGAAHALGHAPGLEHLRHFDLTPERIQALITHIDQKITWATSAEGSFETLITTGFMPAQVIFTTVDWLVNGAMSTGKETYITQMVNSLREKAIEGGTPEQAAEEFAKTTLKVMLSLAIATTTGIGIHMMLNSSSQALHAMATFPGEIANVNMSIFLEPNTLSAAVQKVLTIKLAGVIYGKMAMIVQEIEKAKPEDKARILQERKVRAINDFINTYKQNPPLSDAQKEQLENDSVRELVALKNQRGLSESQKTMIDNALIEQDLCTQAIQQLSPSSQLIALKKARFNDFMAHGVIRNPDTRTVTAMNSPDSQIIEYFITLTSTPNLNLEAVKEQSNFAEIKARFELVLFQNKEALQEIFTDERSIKTLNGLGVQNIHMTPIQRLGRFIGRDVLMRYTVGTIISPFVGLYVALTGSKNDVPWYARQFLGTSLFPALYKSVGGAVLFALSPLLALGEYIKNGNASKSAEIFMGGLVAIGTAIKGIGTFAKAVAHPFLEILSRSGAMLAGSVVSLFDPPPVVRALANGALSIGMLAASVFAAVPVIAHGLYNKFFHGQSFMDTTTADFSRIQAPFERGFKSLAERSTGDGFFARWHNTMVDARETVVGGLRSAAYSVKNGFVGAILKWGNDLFHQIKDKHQELIASNNSVVQSEVTSPAEDTRKTLPPDSTQKMIGGLGGHMQSATNPEVSELTMDEHPYDIIERPENISSSVETNSVAKQPNVSVTDESTATSYRP